LTQAPSPKIVRLGWLDFLFLMATLWAVAVKVWMSCAAFDFTGPYHAVFVNVFPGTPSPS
jgi:hypothetical protein